MSRGLVTILLLGLGGCSFEADTAAGPGIVQQNSCTEDSECGPGGACRDGMCIAADVRSPLEIRLEVIPLIMPDGTEALPMRLEGFALEGPTARQWVLPMPVHVAGSIRRADDPVEANVRLVPVNPLPNVQARAITTSTMTDSEKPGDFGVQLLDGVNYVMTVEPLDGLLPPIYQEIEAREGNLPVIDYDTLELVARTFKVLGTPPDRALSMRAVDVESGRPITARRPITDGLVTLTFGHDTEDYRLVISPDMVDPKRTSADTSCDHGSADFPSYNIDAASAPPDKDGLRSVTLPPAPAPIQFLGTVELCEEALSRADSVQSLPISLRSAELRSENDEAVPVRGSFNTNTTASYDEATGALKFCVEVMPGDYEVVVTPPVSMECAIFAERRLLKAPAEQVAATGQLLTLPTTAHIGGTLQTVDQQPLGGATIDAQALGRSEGIELPENDPGVTRYNRSKQATSNAGGMFSLPVDLGSYDVIVKPPAAGGFAWQVFHDVQIGSREVDFMTIIDVGSPVPIEGSLSYRDGNDGDTATLEGAEVRAFTLIEDPLLGERAVHMGTAVVDSEGRFTLLLSATIHEGWY